MNVKVAGKSATVAWSPLQQRPGLLAAATVAGADAFSAPSVRRTFTTRCRSVSVVSGLSIFPALAVLAVLSALSASVLRVLSGLFSVPPICRCAGADAFQLALSNVLMR